MTVPSLARFKTCNFCSCTLPATEAHFYRNKGGKYGLRATCITCRKLKGRVPWERHRFNRSRVQEKRCTKCGAIKPRSGFYEIKSGKKAGVLSQPCRDCDNARRQVQRRADCENDRAKKRAYYQANREAILAKDRVRRETNREERSAYQKQYREAHKKEKRAYMCAYWPQHYAANREKYIEKSRRRNALRQGHQHRFLKADVRRKYDEQRGLCYWCKKALNGEYEVDHIIPLSKGGTDHPGNICCACQPCNRRKHNKMPWEFSDRLF